MASPAGVRKHVRRGAFVLGALLGATLLLVVELVVFPSLGLVLRHAVPLEERLGNATVALTAKWHAGRQRNPLEENASTLTIGQTGYRPCVECHGAQGDGRGELGQSVFPPVASLLSPGAKEMNDAQLFWIVKNGLSFTAMPSYAKQYRDNGIWAIISYIRVLQDGRALTFGPPPRQSQGQGGESPSGQRFPLVLTDAGFLPATLSAPAGMVELDIVNQGARGRQLVISGATTVPFNAGRVLPTQTLQLSGQLDAGDYSVAADPGANPAGPVATLTVR